MSDELREQIAADAAKPASISADGVQTTLRPVGDLVEADRYLKATAAAAKPRRLLRVFKVNPGGPG